MADEMRERHKGCRQIGGGGLIAVAILAALALQTTAALGALPDGRGYELVTPIEKNGENVLTNWTPTPVIASGPASAYFAAPDGRRVLFGLIGEPGAVNGTSDAFLATRGASGWTTEPLSPPAAAEHPEVVPFSLGVAVFADVAQEDLSRPLFAVYGPLEAGAAGDTVDLYERKGPDSYVRLSRGENQSTGEDGMGYVGRSADGRHILFASSARLTPEAAGLAPGIPELYDSAGGATRVVGILPASDCAGQSQCVDEGGAMLGDGYAQGNGTSYPGASGAPAVPEEHAVSADGSRIFFESPWTQEAREVYMREDGVRTVEISLSQKSGSIGAPASRAEFAQASADGARVIFVSPDELTDDATEGGGLYEYDLNAGLLRFLAPDSQPGGAAVIGASADASRIYFFAEAQLVPGRGEAGRANVYLYTQGEVRYVATLSSEDHGRIGRSGAFSEPGEVRTTPDGRYLLFASNEPITGYDSGGFYEIYRYDAAADDVVCISCDPRHAPTASAALYQSGLPRESASVEPSQYSLPRNMTPDGAMVFFETADPLVPQATTGKVNVYEWHNGVVSLISSGWGPDDAHFLDASRDGADVFFTSFDRLTPGDGDGNRDIYDARIGGGVGAGSIQAACDGVGCHTGEGPAAPAILAPGSERVPGAPAPAPRPLAKHKRRHHRPRRHKRRGTRRARRHTSTSSNAAAHGHVRHGHEGVQK